MEENSQRAILIGVSVLIIVVLISAVIIIVTMGRDMTSTQTKQIAKLSSQMQKTLTNDYDDENIPGAQVVAAAKYYYDSDELSIVIKNKSAISYLGKYKINISGAIESDGRLIVPYENIIEWATSGETKTALRVITEKTASSLSAHYVASTNDYHARLIMTEDKVILRNNVSNKLKLLKKKNC